MQSVIKKIVCMGKGKVGHADFFNRTSNASKLFVRGFPFLPKNWRFVVI